MKIASTLLIVLGSLMIVLNFFGWLGTNGLRTDLKGVNFLAYYVGYNLFLIVGIILILVGYRLRRKAITKRNEKQLLDGFLNNNPNLPE